MRIQLINPNTSADMTHAMALSAQSIALPTTQIIASTPEHGPKASNALLMKSLPAPPCSILSNKANNKVSTPTLLPVLVTPR